MESEPLICKKCQQPREKSRCVSCRKISDQRSREKRAAIYRDRQANRYEEARALMAELKSQPCVDCGGTFPWFCMDFDHVDPKTKVNSISQMFGSGSIKRILEEVAKCELLCCVCHRIRTFLQKEDGITQVGRPRKYTHEVPLNEPWSRELIDSLRS